MTTATVRTPGTAANLGPGFDAFGLAVERYDTCTAELTGSGLEVLVDGEGASDVPRDESHLVVCAMRQSFARLGVEAPGLRVQTHNVLPHGRGLGSSASAIVAGVRLAEALAVDALGARPFTDDEALAAATAMEGHPDNVAPCLFGGLTVSWTEPTGPRTARVDVHPGVLPVAFVSSEAVPTSVARGLLPAQVPHELAAANAARAGLLVLGLTTDPRLLLAGTEDRLHQPFRRPAMPASMDLVEGLRADGVPAVVSGAGPTVLAFAVTDAVGPAGDVEELRRRCPSGWSVEVLGVDRLGAQILERG